MRTLGMLAIFILSLVSIVEGAYLFKLSRRVTALSHEPAGAVDDREEAVASRSALSAPVRPHPIVAGASRVPSFQTLAPPSTTPATTTLREALATTEGREQLKAAMEVIAEEKRQTRLVESLPRRAERDQRFRERIMKAVPLAGDEPLKLSSVFTSLQAARQQTIDDMHAGLKNAEQTDEALDQVREEADKQIHALLGDDRWKKIQNGRRGGWGGGQGGPNGGGNNGPSANNGAAAGNPTANPGAPPSVAAGNAR
jgi:hypothetical protein